MKRILCLLGVHQWKESKTTFNGSDKYITSRYCERCMKSQTKTWKSIWLDTNKIPTFKH